MKKYYFIFIVTWFAFGFLNAQNRDYTQYVNPLIGTGGHGHTFPGATVPFGMVQLSPDTRLTGWDGCSAYHYSDSVIYGFSHTHLSGTGCSDYGDILLMPASGEVNIENYAYASEYRKDQQIAKAGYYSVRLEKNDIQAELTATARVGLHKYTYKTAKSNYIVLDLQHRDMNLGSEIEVVSDNHIRGFRRSRAWADNQIVYFDIQFSKSFTKCGLCLIDSTGKVISTDAKKAVGKRMKAYFCFENQKEIIVKVALSATSVDGALRNMNAETSGFDFEKIAINAKELWNKELGKIEVKSDNKDDMVKFYSALYHCMIQPNIYSDADGSYLGRDMKVHPGDGHDYYTVFSIWDTYRAEHPLFTIIDTRRTNDFISTFLKQYQYGGLLPVWELSSNETFCMIGYHSVSVIADAYLKGIRNYDATLALKAMKTSADTNKFGLKSYRDFGFLPGDKENESVSRTLEYAYDDWCIAMMAKALDQQNDYIRFVKRAQSYKNIYDPQTGFMRPKMNGSWYSPFDPTEVNFNFTEANSWQYSFYVPQDISGLIALHGGKENFEKKLDELFTTTQSLSGREQADITGLIGQYAHGNEPSHHMAYLYNYVNKPTKTQGYVNKILNELYAAKPDGLCGNEDCGQMSAWFVLSSLGMYQVCPGNSQFSLSTPLFPEISVHLENGKTLQIITNNRTHENCYITKATFNGNPYTKSFLDYSDIVNGGTLEYTVSSKPLSDWGRGTSDAPVTGIVEHQILPSPYTSMTQKTFSDSLSVALNDLIAGAKIYYTLDGTTPTNKSQMYQHPIIIKNNCQLNYIAYHPTYGYSQMGTSQYFKTNKSYKISIKYPYSPQYTGGGDNALINGLRGGSDFRLGDWQGYFGKNLDATIDLGEVKKVHKITAGFLQDQGAWILMPKSVTFEYSLDGKTYIPICTLASDTPDNVPDAVVKDFTCEVPMEAKFIRVVAENYGTLPSWHLGAGNDSWIFADEIVVE
jgi:predicted alpha-1,2-mannosidase